MKLLVVEKVKPGNIVFFKKIQERCPGIPSQVDFDKAYTVKEVQNAIAEWEGIAYESNLEIIQEVILEEMPNFTFRSSLFKLENNIISMEIMERILEYTAGIFANIYSGGSTVKKFTKNECVKTTS